MSVYIPVELQKRIRNHFVNYCAYCQTAESLTIIIGLTPVGRATIPALKMNRLQLTHVRRMWVKMGEHPPKI